jgi:hypothetical protein
MRLLPFSEELTVRSLAVTAIVTPDHTVTVTVPPDIPPGPRQVVLVIAEEVQQPAQGRPDIRNWPPPHDVGPVDPNMTFRREDMYGDDGR